MKNLLAAISGKGVRVNEDQNTAKVTKLESQFNEMHLELRLVNANLKSINDTLMEFKKISSDVSEIKTQIALDRQHRETQEAKLNLLFKKNDANDTRLKNLETGDTKQDLKLSSIEKFTWIVLSACVTLGISFFFKRG